MCKTLWKKISHRIYFYSVCPSTKVPYFQRRKEVCKRFWNDLEKGKVNLLLILLIFQTVNGGKRRGCKKYDVRSFIYLTPIKGFRLGHPYSFQCMEDQKKKELCFVRWRYWFFFRREQNPESNFSDVKIRFSNHYVSHIPFRLQTPPDEHCSRNCDSAILHLWFKQKKDLYFHNISFI